MDEANDEYFAFYYKTKMKCKNIPCIPHVKWSSPAAVDKSLFLRWLNASFILGSANKYYHRTLKGIQHCVLLNALPNQQLKYFKMHSAQSRQCNIPYKEAWDSARQK